MGKEDVVFIHTTGSCAAIEMNEIMLFATTSINPKDGGAWWATVHGVAKS